MLPKLAAALSVIFALAPLACDAPVGVSGDLRLGEDPSNRANTQVVDDANAQREDKAAKVPRPRWNDVDRDCQHTRSEVLLAENLDESALEYADNDRCVVNRGVWRCPYTGERLTRAKELDIDHMVPLKNAWGLGGREWPKEKWTRFANDLSHPQHLIAVLASANRSKGARGPEDWLPPLPSYRCTYVRDWVDIKARWGLERTPDEHMAISEALRLCDAGHVPPLPQGGSEARESKPKPKPKPKSKSKSAPASCCKTCHKGKACGDTCIPRDRTCEHPSGCACDG